MFLNRLLKKNKFSIWTFEKVTHCTSSVVLRSFLSAMRNKEIGLLCQITAVCRIVRTCYKR